MLTAKATQADKVEGLQQGADAYLTKPFDKKELLVRIEQLMEKQQRLQTYFSKNKSLPKEAKIENEFLHTLIKTIKENISNEAFGLSQLCDAVFLERTQLYRKVKALTGSSPSELIRKTRMEHAHYLLLHSEKTIKEISFQCGYQDPSNFSKVFKKQFGQLPSQIRN